MYAISISNLSSIPAMIVTWAKESQFSVFDEVVSLLTETDKLSSSNSSTSLK